jgi:hypothetical protein
MSSGFFKIAMPVLAIVVPAVLAGCSSSSDLNQTAAIAAPAATGVAAPGGTAPAVMGEDGQVVVGAKGAPVATTAVQAVPVAMADCDQLKLELASFKADKTAEKLAQFGQSKYTPTPDESTRFARYVAVNQANKEKCGTVASAPVVRKKTMKKAAAAAAPAAEKAVVEKAAAVVKPVAKVKKVVKAKVDAAIDPLMDPTNQAADPAQGEGVTTTGSSG